MSKHDCDDDPDCQYCHHVCALQPVREPPPVPEAPALPEGLDCGDNSCLYARKKVGMRTNGGCQCELTINAGRANEQRVEMHHLRRALASQGLRVVTEAEARVLEACAALTVDDRDDVYTVNGWVPVAEAELARRGRS